MQKTAVFPGSFDPFTVGHESIVNRSIFLFDKIIIAIGYNSNKASYFPVEKREEWIKRIFEGIPNIAVEVYDGLTIDFCRDNNAKYILRGLRTSADFEYERAVGQINKAMLPGVETIYLLTNPEHTAISSTIVREIIRYGGDVSKFVPEVICSEIKKQAKQNQ